MRRYGVYKSIERSVFKSSNTHFRETNMGGLGVYRSIERSRIRLLKAGITVVLTTNVVKISNVVIVGVS